MLLTSSIRCGEAAFIRAFAKRTRQTPPAYALHMGYAGAVNSIEVPKKKEKPRVDKPAVLFSMQEILSRLQLLVVTADLGKA